MRASVLRVPENRIVAKYFIADDPQMTTDDPQMTIYDPQHLHARPRGRIMRAHLWVMWVAYGSSVGHVKKRLLS